MCNMTLKIARMLDYFSCIMMLHSIDVMKNIVDIRHNCCLFLISNSLLKCYSFIHLNYERRKHEI